MKWDLIHTKLHALLISWWGIIKDAMAPRWAAMMPPDEPNNPGEEYIAKKDITPIQDDANTSSLPSPSPSLPGKEVTSNIPTSDTNNKVDHEAALATNEEVVRLRERLKELEKDAAERNEVARTMDELRDCARKERENTGRVGRPPKQSKKVTFNLQMRWSLLYELGNDIGAIELEKTQFYNIAIELLLKTNYPQLYALYIRSITNEEQSETIRD